MSRGARPRIVLVGAGRFGICHLRTLQRLQDEGRLELLRVITKRRASARRIAREYRVRTDIQLSPALLKEADGVVIATPSHTHVEIGTHCLAYTNVLVEKPMTLTVQEADKLLQIARRHKHILMVGHVFRFHPVVRRLKGLVRRYADSLCLIEGTFLNPGSPDVRAGALATFLHHFDILDFLLERAPSSVQATTSHLLRKDAALEDAAYVSLRFPPHICAWIEVGWIGVRKTRDVTLTFLHRSVHADLLTGEITIERPGYKLRTVQVDVGEPLRRELECFARILQGVRCAYPDGAVGRRITALCVAAQRSAGITARPSFKGARA